MEDKNKDFLLPENGFLADEPPLMEEIHHDTPELQLSPETTAPVTDEKDIQLPLHPFPAEGSTTTTQESEQSLSVSEDDELDKTRVYAPFVPAAEPEQADFALTGQSLHEEAAAEDPQQEELITPLFTENIAPDEEAMAAYDLVAPIQTQEQPAAVPVAEEAAEDALKPARKTPQAVRKGRPKRKKGYGLLGIPHILATGVWLAIILVIGITLGRFLWVCAADILAFGRESSKVSVTITANDTIEDIAEKLHEAGLVRYPGLFELYAGIAVDEGDILPGTFEMDTLYDYHALVIQMGPRSSNRAVIEDVLIPEGYNCRQIFALLEEKGICTVAELEEYAANGEFADFWFLEGVERGDKYCLEGFLFPDTYDFYAHSTPREALGKMLLGFENRFTQEIYDQLPALNERLSKMMRNNGCSEEFISANQLDLRDLLTVASLIEEETSSSKESPTIASVIFNRLTQDQEHERYLGIDATILYALGEHTDTLTQEDLAIDSPYNTRTHAGLVPGPITNPGLDSINAALNFADTNYYYYVLNPETYVHDFSRTLEEHEQKVEKYRALSQTEGE